ncbi:MAG TPA: hypothetical protein VLV88_15385 [Terriglobales bacterium]|nr:hypothetical protein [Terriglobales bacterium]
MSTQARLASLLLIVFWASAACFGQSQKRGPSTAEERAKAVKIAQDLQTDPLSRSVQPEREWLIQWLIEIPDIGVDVCGGLLGDLGDKGTGYPGAILSAMLGSEAAAIIEHPEKAKDKQEIYVAGVDGALNAYQAIRKQDSKYDAPKLDEFLARRNEGKLKDGVAEATKVLKCE